MTSIDYNIYRSFFFHNVYYEIQKWFEKHENRTSNDAVLSSLNKLMCDLDPKKWQVTYIKREFANQIVYVLKLLETPIKELDINLWQALEKCIKYYEDLCKEEEEEIEHRKNTPQTDIGFDMMPESEEEESKTEEKSDVDGDETEEVHFVHHHTKPLVLFDETEIIDENECEKEGLEKFEYEELPSHDEDEDDDSDEDDGCNKKEEEDPGETITIITSITRKRMRNVDYDKNDDVEKHEKPKKRLRCVCMFPRIIKYYF